MTSQVHIATARKYLTESFDEFPGIEVYITNLALLLEEAEALGARNAACGSKAVSIPVSPSISKVKGKGNPYATMVKIISAIGSGKTQALTDTAASINVVTVNNINGKATKELWATNDYLKELADGQSMSLIELITKARTLGKNTVVSSVVYGILSAETVQEIIDRCLPLCPPK
jgi:predicted transcriptional regulator